MNYLYSPTCLLARGQVGWQFWRRSRTGNSLIRHLNSFTSSESLTLTERTLLGNCSGRLSSPLGLDDGDFPNLMTCFGLRARRLVRHLPYPPSFSAAVEPGSSPPASVDLVKAGWRLWRTFWRIGESAATLCARVLLSKNLTCSVLFRSYF